jgi:transcriptional regulator with XRE-family HTH domain
MGAMNKKLQQARLDRHWSATEAARRIGISRVTYMRWESGEQIPHDSTLVMACSIFKMSPEALGFEIKKPQIQRSSSELVVLDTGVSYLTLDVGASRSLYGDLQDALMFIWQSHGCSFLDLQTQVAKAMDKLEKTTNAPQHSRRDMLKFLAGLPISVANLAFTGNSRFMPVDEVLPLYLTGVPACWKLYYEGDWQKVREVLPSYISQLTSVARSPSKSQKTAASLLSQVHQLASA